MADDPAAAILALLDERAPDATICPSEAARRIDPIGWRDVMPAIHAAVRGLAASGAVAVTQSGRVKAPDAIVGAYRIRKAAPGDVG